MFLSFVNQGHGNSFPSEQPDPFVGWLYFRRQFFFLIRRHRNWGRLVALHRWRGRGARSRLCWPRPCGLRGVVTSGQRPLLQEPDGQDRARSRHLATGVSGAPLSGARGRSPRLAVVSGRHAARARTRRTWAAPAPCAPVPWVNTTNRDVRRPRCQLAPAFSTFFEASLPCGIVSGGNSHAVHGASVLRPLQVSPTGARHRTPRPSNLSPSRL